MQIISQDAAVPVAGAEDLSAALAYGNHSSSARFSPHTLEKIVEDVSHGRSFVFPREIADKIPGIRISPLTVAESTSKVRIRHDLNNANSGRSVNENTERLFFPDFKIGHALRSVVSIFLFLYFNPRILLAKQDTKLAFPSGSGTGEPIPIFWVSVRGRSRG